MTKTIAIILSLAALVSAATAEETLREISWSAWAEQGRLSVGEVLAADNETGIEQLKLENTESKARTFALMSIENPGITAARYAITGKVRYEGVKGAGYLEMWNYFPDGEMYFSRTLGDSGPMQSIAGSSDWRPFTLPFYINTDPAPQPSKLDFNVVLPGRGTVYLSPLRLVQYAPPKVKAWWSEKTAGLLGGIVGAAGGLMGALIGVLGGFGKARKVLIGCLIFMFISGLASLAVGLAALIFLGQPYYVCHLLIMGVIPMVLGIGLIPTCRRRYDELELRKMRAMDIS